MLKEFKEFAMRGNVVDMAVGVVMGAAFGTIVTSLVNDLLMPLLGLILGDADFTNLFIVLSEGSTSGPYETLSLAQEAGAVTLNYGLFINAVISFLIIAIAIFFLIRAINRLQKQEEASPAEPTTKECNYCFSEIPLQAVRCPNCTSEL
jgi:large conductance mechanosensitive channel